MRDFASAASEKLHQGLKFVGEFTVPVARDLG
jgi:hypothetical protein